MKKGKQLRISLCFIVLCMLMLGGCKKNNVGAPEDNPQIEEPEEDTKKEYVFGYSAMTMENPYFVTLESAIRQEVEREGAVLITEDPKNDSDLQIEQIKAMIERGIDAIFLNPVDSEKITPALKLLKKAGVKIINIDTQVTAFDDVDAYIGSDNKHAGYVCGKDLVEKQKKGGKILIIENPSAHSINERIKGFEEAVAGKGFEVVGRADSKGERTLARSVTEELLRQYPDVQAIMCANDLSAMGALDAANALGLKNISIYGVDGSPEVKKEIAKEDSLIIATGGQSPIEMGKEAVKTTFKILRKEKYERLTYEETFLINKENLNMYGIDGWQ